jgi:hypothetical protein
MNIKTKLILAATAVSLLSTPAFAFRDMGDEGGDSAFAIPEGHSDSGMGNYGGWYSRPGVPAYASENPYSAYASGQRIRRRHPIQRQPSYQGWGGGYEGWAGGHNDW